MTPCSMSKVGATTCTGERLRAACILTMFCGSAQQEIDKLGQRVCQRLRICVLGSPGICPEKLDVQNYVRQPGPLRKLQRTFPKTLSAPCSCACACTHACVARAPAATPALHGLASGGRPLLFSEHSMEPRGRELLPHGVHADGHAGNQDGGIHRSTCQRARGSASGFPADSANAARGTNRRGESQPGRFSQRSVSNLTGMKMCRPYATHEADISS